MELISIPNPHMIPGYTGHCPQYIYRCGDSFGNLTHKVLTDPCIAHSDKLIIPNPSKVGFIADKPTPSQIALVKEHEARADAVYKYPMVPGYSGHVPNLATKVGQTSNICATEALSEFESLQKNLICEARKLQHRTNLQDLNSFNRSAGERVMLLHDYRLPLLNVRPEAQGVARGKILNLGWPPNLHSKAKAPLFMEHNDPEKYVALGYMGHLPFESIQFGVDNKKITHEALVDFKNNFDHRRSTEWAPITNTLMAPPRTGGVNISIEIYPKDGVIPLYGGHVPGEKFTFGQPFKQCTVDAKQWITPKPRPKHNIEKH